MQISWLKNLIALREDQVKQKIVDAVKNVGSDLSTLKEQLTPIQNDDPLDIFERKSYRDFLTKRLTIGSRLSAKDIQNRIRKALNDAELENLKFEYAMMVGPFTGYTGTIERESENFMDAQADTIHNYLIGPALILSPSGSPSENLTNGEALLVVALDWKKYVMRSIAWKIALAILFTLVIVAAFYLTVYTMLRQKKLSDIKNDFINNMTHEFKTPIATISLAVDALKNEKVMGDKDKMSYFSEIIKEENHRMNKQVETILKASQFDKQEADLEMKPLSVHKIIGDVVDNFQLQLHDKNGDSELNLTAANDVINGDEVHFTNLVNNLIDNAVKYSKENVPIHLKISTANTGKNLVMKFEDNGIGMSKETQKRVFEKFYRAHTGNLHNVKGFGLGLSYVKSVTESHNGNIKVDSTLGKGTVFSLEFPLAETV